MGANFTLFRQLGMFIVLVLIYCAIFTDIDANDPDNSQARMILMIGIFMALVFKAVEYFRKLIAQLLKLIIVLVILLAFCKSWTDIETKNPGNYEKIEFS